MHSFVWFDDASTAVSMNNWNKRISWPIRKDVDVKQYKRDSWNDVSILFTRHNDESLCALERG